MLFFILTSVSFIFFLNSLNICIWNDLCISSSYSLLHKTIPKQTILAMKTKDLVVSTFSLRNISSVVVVDDPTTTTELLDLPELALDSILERLSPNGLCSMGAVCRSLRDRCTRNNLWEAHLRRKWGRVLGPAVYREWKWFVESKMSFSSSSSRKKCYGFSKFFEFFKGLTWFQSKFDKSINNKVDRSNNMIVDSVRSWYLALESGKFWFPAQVYNRENGHVGFMLSCYDAELSYDSQTDTFNARYPPHGLRAIAIETGVQWDRLRVSPVETSPHDLHVSDCLHDLCPGDHIEIQWRRNKEFPYGWWYGVVGHLEPCDGNEHYCRCCNSDTVVLEFNQYTPGSRWRTTHVSRKDHREEGNENNGFYGGIRKLYKNDEIATWKRLWPPENLE